MNRIYMITPYTLSKVRLFKAVLPIMIVLHHLSFFYGSPPGFARLGLPLVACFFLMSGYGLMTSYMNKGQKYFQGFIAHVFNKLLIPYLVAVIVYVSFVMYVQQVNVLEYLSTTSFIDWLRFSWFVWVILGGYLFFFLIFRTHMTDKIKLSLYAIASLSYYLLCIYVFEDKLPCLYRTSYALLLGLIWKYYEPRIVSFLNTKYMIIPVTIISTVGFVLAVKSDDMLFNPLFAAMTFVCFAYLIPLHKDYAAVKVLSKISYEYYLWQGLSIAVVFDCLNCKSMLIAISLCLLINAVLSIIAHYLYNNSCQNLVHQKV